MSKNTGVIESVESIPANAVKDYVFKEIAKHKVIMSLILKVAISEFAGMELADIARCIKDNRKREDSSDEAILNDEVDLLLTETGTGGEKETRNDMVIAVEIPGRGTADFRLARTINLEMQGNTRKSKLGYDIKQRAIYYAASLLRGTVARGDRTYYSMAIPGRRLNM